MSINEAAIAACRRLVEAYALAEDTGSVDWYDLDQAHEMALAVLKRLEDIGITT